MKISAMCACVGPSAVSHPSFLVIFVLISFLSCLPGLIPVARELRDAPERNVEQRLELACQLVKQAHSECPNLDRLIEAILAAPLYR